MIRFESGDSNHLPPALTGNAVAYAPQLCGTTREPHQRLMAGASFSGIAAGFLHACGQ